MCSRLISSWVLNAIPNRSSLKNPTVRSIGRERRAKTRQKKRKRGSGRSRMFLKLGGGKTNVQIQEAHQIPVMIITKKNKLRHIIVQFLKTKNKQNIMKPDREKNYI